MTKNVRIAPLRFFTQRVLPAVYTDELSYYEVLAKVVDKLNELIGVVGDSATIEQIQQVIKDIEKELSALYVYVDKEVQGAKDYSDDQNDILEKYLESLIVNATEKTAQEIDGYDATAYTDDLYNAVLLNGNSDLPVQDGN